MQQQIKTGSVDIFKKYVVFDLETTSKEPDRCGIVEIAAIKIENGKIVDEFQALVNPGIPIEPEAEAIHKISNKDIQSAPSVESVWNDFVEFVGDELILAHNGYYFDFKIMDRTARSLKKPRLKNTRYDSLILARNLFSGQQNSIDALADRFKVDTGNRHRALDDVKALHYIFQKMLETNDRRDAKSLGEEFTEYVCLGNIVENQLTAKEDKILYMAGISKLLSPYSKILPEYVNKFSLNMETYKSNLNAQAKRIWPTVNLYASDEAFIRRILDMALEFKSLHIDMAIAEFLTYLSLLNPQDQLTAIDAISLLTLHSAKGLEFDKVIILGMEDENIPSFFAYQTDGEDDRPVSKKIEEQKRLLYVGITRAREEVIFTVVKNRFGRKQKSSPFLDEIKEKISINQYS
jgi:DNA polymerase III epsilon subunit family exonuclease